jgi:hypothetical protein
MSWLRFQLSQQQQSEYLNEKHQRIELERKIIDRLPTRSANLISTQYHSSSRRDR